MDEAERVETERRKAKKLLRLFLDFGSYHPLLDPNRQKVVPEAVDRHLIFPANLLIHADM